MARMYLSRRIAPVAIALCLLGLSKAANGQAASPNIFDDHSTGTPQVKTAPATQPGAAHIEAGPEASKGDVNSIGHAYEDAARAAKIVFYKSLVEADKRQLASLEQLSLKQKDDPAKVQSIDAARSRASERLKEHEAALQSLTSPHDSAALIVSARFGTGNQWSDVTERIRTLTTSADPVRANPDGLGVDPAPGWRKELEVTYFRNGERRTVQIHEDGEIRVGGLVPLANDRIDSSD